MVANADRPAPAAGSSAQDADGTASQAGHGGAPRLWAVYLGGDPEPGRLSEDHEAVLVVAADLKSARAAARAKWSGAGRGHVDAVRQVDVVDGFAVHLEPTVAAEDTLVDTTYEP